MANQEHLDILKQGVGTWNEWRAQNYLEAATLDRIRISDGFSRTDLRGANFLNTDFSWSDLSRSDLIKADLRWASFIRTNLQEADLSEANLSRATLNGAFLEEATLKRTILTGANLSKADLSGADLSGADLSRTKLFRASFHKANLHEANLSGADLGLAGLIEADLSGADLSGTNLFGANLSFADLSNANLDRASLRYAILVHSNLTKAILKNCMIYGIAAWDVQLEETVQENLVITDFGQSTITVDNLKIAQFIYLLLNNEEIRDVIDTITSKVVLILGRFTPERKAVLDTLKEALRTHGYLPIMFDFEKPSSQDLTETVMTLAHLSRFIIADLTDPGCIPYELHAVVPNRMVPVLPLLKEVIDPLTGKPIHEFALFRDLRKKYHWVLPTHSYKDRGDLLASLEAKVIEPAEQKVQELEKR